MEVAETAHDNDTNTINRRTVAKLISKLSHEMEDIVDALLEKKESVGNQAFASVLLRSSWITRGVFSLTNDWAGTKRLEDDGKVIFLRSSWITAGAEPRCN
ncbi:MAG TPA: hypothetical protein DCR97_12790 [Deltaproteobacteria bacterium]|nr:hypothetical protein [Deltaproteobacteria bacterium]